MLVGMMAVIIGAYVGWRYIVVPFWRATDPEAVERMRVAATVRRMEREREAQRRVYGE